MAPSRQEINFAHDRQRRGSHTNDEHPLPAVHAVNAMKSSSHSGHHNSSEHTAQRADRRKECHTFGDLKWFA